MTARQPVTARRTPPGALFTAARGAPAGAVFIAAGGAPVTVFGRAGGGGHSGAVHSSSTSNTGSSSFGGGSGGSLGGIVTLIIIALIVAYIVRRVRAGSQSAQIPAGAPPAAQAALSALGAALGASAMARVGAAPSMSGALPNRPELPAAIDAIRAEDPGFEMESFLQRAEMTFFLVKRGVQKGDAAAIRPYVNDAVFGEVSRNIGEMKAQHRHALLESLNVRAVHLESAACGEQAESLQIHFDLVYRAKTLDDAGQVQADEGEDRRHGERWTFARNAGARTPVSGGVTASRCPACGAELRLNLDGTCAHCRASVTNGTVDWVVVDVQPTGFVGYSGDSQFAAAAPTVGQGIANMQAADKDFSMDAFQSRVKQAFLALQEAWCKQNLDAGRAFLSPGAYFTWSAQLETLAAEGRRNVMENVQVRALQPTRIVHGRVFDDLTVRIAAAAADFDVDKNEKVVFGDRSVRPFVEEWTFQRSVGVATSNKPGTLENTCPNCGAPIALTQIGECRYCKAAVTSGKFDWVVSRIEQEDGGSEGSGDFDRAGEQLALQVGGAIVGGLLSSLLSGKSSSRF